MDKVVFPFIFNELIQYCYLLKKQTFMLLLVLLLWYKYIRYKCVVKFNYYYYYSNSNSSKLGTSVQNDSSASSLHLHCYFQGMVGSGITRLFSDPFFPNSAKRPLFLNLEPRMSRWPEESKCRMAPTGNTSTSSEDSLTSHISCTISFQRYVWGNKVFFWSHISYQCLATPPWS